MPLKAGHFSVKIPGQVSVEINIGRSTSSCGVCTYYSVTGSLNSINGNASSGTNGGSVAAQGNFNN